MELGGDTSAGGGGGAVVVVVVGALAHTTVSGAGRPVRTGKMNKMNI